MARFAILEPRSRHSDFKLDWQRMNKTMIARSKWPRFYNFSTGGKCTVPQPSATSSQLIDC